ncbi:hypothetical protein SAMN00017405_0197 [Desulfonispora thiosulfatigenes DSM 11270]|uniref:Aminoacetone oxidase family FAD-binding enzyme n=1 Tax=Desulfonispora thiosulfatigenes DSM 11270 TaxID=656914 RepID=A0A1W1VM07_DESTI|nr:NAD(P)/FAD-dependent oxidoreductase [Desulfonispora thiosulfatigenes]SMB94387.1 hypothetical protein SAMN00017405_0197 [Desulfonispora thiosulfatigenes DSM 11270]
MSEKVDVIVIGAGAGGMMAAGRAAERGAKVILIEKNSILGKKLLITGKGRCNVTNDTDIEDIISNFPGNGRFLYSPLYTFTNLDVMNFFTNLGVKLKTERGGRVFPVSDKAKDIVKALEKYLQLGKVKVIKNSKVEEIISENGGAKIVHLEGGEKIKAPQVIIATGGLSYPGTGSTGDGYLWSEKLGHKIVTPKPSLIPLITKESWIEDLQGLSLKNITISLNDRNGKKIAQDFGEMIFTHYGVSGPVVLSISRKAVLYWEKNSKPLNMSIDLKPALSIEKLDLRLQRDFEKYCNKDFRNGLNDLLPQRLIPIVIMLAKIDPYKKINLITKEERQNLNYVIKNLKLTATGTRPISEAIVTKGGVNVKEINPHTMESKKINGLFFCGEIIDIDGYTGGYNLQAAFSTGYLAGENISIYE